MNPMVNMAMNMLKSMNPQGFSQVSQMIQNRTNPQNILKQLTENASAQQMQNVMQQAKQMGVPDEILNQLQNMK
jgi:phage shock protein A